MTALQYACEYISSEPMGGAYISVATVIPQSYNQGLGLRPIEQDAVRTIPVAMNHKIIVTGKAMIYRMT